MLINGQSGFENRSSLPTSPCSSNTYDRPPKTLPISLPIENPTWDSTDLVMLPMHDGFMEWQEAPELAEVINCWFDLPRPIVAAILAMIRASRSSSDV